MRISDWSSDVCSSDLVFPVIERDLLEQIHTRLTAMEKSGETQRLNQELKRRTAARVNRPAPVAGLVRASGARRWSFDPPITLKAGDRGATGQTPNDPRTRRPAGRRGG